MRKWRDFTFGIDGNPFDFVVREAGEMRAGTTLPASPLAPTGGPYNSRNIDPPPAPGVSLRDNPNAKFPPFSKQS